MDKIALDLSYHELNKLNQIKRINTYIDFGNYLRQGYGNDILAMFSIVEIVENRNKNSGDFQKTAYIVDQLKTEDEIDLLREVYGDAFLQISVYSARDIRVDNLAKMFARDNKKGDRNLFRSDAESLIVKDEDEKANGRDVPHGQKVGKIFQLADIVVNVDKSNGDDCEGQIDRFIEIIFGSNKHSPTVMEYGMFLAFSAALRSLDLSRQVGAAIFRPSGEIAAFGANEVPKAGGGTYWSYDGFDAREYQLGEDSNDFRKIELLNEIVEILKGDIAISSDQERLLRETRFMDALEYGRIVHAEMCALMDAARLGISVKDGTIYCTTFPCHMCTKHIVAAGVRTVVFLEPYPKSLAADLHSDSVKIEGMSRGAYDRYPYVEFVPFSGVTPRRYREFFSRKKRKNSMGVFLEYINGEPKPIFGALTPWHGEKETEIIRVLSELIRDGWSGEK